MGLEENYRAARQATPDLLESENHPPFWTINRGSRIPVLLVCDHASNRIPKSLNGLGLEQADLDRHIACDLGTAKLTARLAEMLGVCAVMCNYSRLVVDCNRREDDPSCFPAVSDGTVVPGNQNLSEREKQNRLDSIYHPYHLAVSEALDYLKQFATAPAVIAIHSFTPQLSDQEPRPWDVGLLWDKDERLAKHFIDYFSIVDHLNIGENLPYSGKELADYTIDTHGEARGLPCISLEIRNEHILDEKGLAHWMSLLEVGIERLLADQEVFSKLAVA